ITERRTPGTMRRHSYRVHPPVGRRQQFLVPVDCVLTRFTNGLLRAPTGKPASDSLGICFQVAKPVKSRPFSSVPVTAPKGAVKLNHHEQGPAIEESPQWTERLAQVDVLSAGVRHCRRELAVAEGGRQGEGRGDD